MVVARKRPAQPWWVWASAVVATSILAFQIQARRYDYVMVIGGGAVAGIDRSDAPAGIELRNSAKRSEEFAETARRVENALQLRPPILVIGLDAGQLRDRAAVYEARGVLDDVARKATRSATRTIIVGFAPPAGAGAEVLDAMEDLNAWMRADLCGRDGITCVMPQDEGEEGLPGALADASGG